MLLSFETLAPHDTHILFISRKSPITISKWTAVCDQIYVNNYGQILNDHLSSNYVFIAKSINYTVKVSAVNNCAVQLIL
jgi:hypothetical protein